MREEQDTEREEGVTDGEEDAAWPEELAIEQTDHAPERQWQAAKRGEHETYPAERAIDT